MNIHRPIAVYPYICIYKDICILSIYIYIEREKIEASFVPVYVILNNKNLNRCIHVTVLCAQLMSFLFRHRSRQPQRPSHVHCTQLALFTCRLKGVCHSFYYFKGTKFYCF